MNAIATRIGNWIALADGRPWYPLDPRPDEVSVETIAHHLSNICRYSGAPRFTYSVAHHVVLVCRWLRENGATPIEQMVGLHHDDPEGISGFGDVVRPMKREVPVISQIEDNIYQRAIVQKFGLPADMPAIVHEADIRICGDEKEQVLNPALIPWKEMPVPLGITIVRWSAEEAKANYLQEHYRLVEEISNG